MAEIQDFLNFDVIFKKKLKYLGNMVKVTQILQEPQHVQNDFLHSLQKVYTHLVPGKRNHKWQYVSFKFN